MRYRAERLVEIDVASMARHGGSALLLQIGFGFLCAGVFVILRTALDWIVPSAGPYALIYPAVLIATLFGRWQAGAATFLCSFLWTWIVVLPKVSLLILTRPSDGPRTIVNAAAILVVLIFAELFRDAVRKASAQRDSALSAMGAREGELRDLNETLENQVAGRTAELRAINLSLESLVDARVVELRTANEEIQRFAYIVSHDLRAPLVNVLGFTSELDALRIDLCGFLNEVASKTPEMVTSELRLAVETDLPEALGFIRSSTQKMDRLITAILKLSREGRRQMTPQQIDLASLMATQRASLTQQLSARDATLIVQDCLPTLVSDKLAIEQIFGNLIENAVKYLLPDRAGRIVVTGRANGSMVTYDIADNGRGIDAKDFERVFELFRRSGEQNTQGEGIGLAYVRNLTRRLGGDVTVRSVLGVGSTFTVVLPAMFGQGSIARQP